MKLVTLILGLVGLNGVAVHADDVPAPGAIGTEQAQAREFGIFFGGMASQYDLCVKKACQIACTETYNEGAAKLRNSSGQRQFD